MPSYDSIAHDPPAPTAVVSLHSLLGDHVVSGVILLIDTGADATLLPREAVERLGVRLDVSNRDEVVGFDGTRTFLHAAEVEMRFLNKSFRGRYLLIEQPHGVLGRDVLAHLRIMLDGPNSEWTAM